MSSYYLSRINKLYLKAKNEHKAYVEPINDNLVKEIYKRILTALTTKNARSSYLNINLSDLYPRKSEIDVVSKLLNEKDISHSVHKKFLHCSIEINF